MPFANIAKRGDQSRNQKVNRRRKSWENVGGSSDQRCILDEILIDFTHSSQAVCWRAPKTNRIDCDIASDNNILINLRSAHNW